ncbi:MAG: ECF transporter S component [Christensenellales bacterium]
MNTQPKQKISVQTLTQLAILVAIEVVMKLIGLGSVPVGPLYMSFLTVPIAIGAIVIGPMASMLLGGIFGFVSFMDAIKGASIMTSTLLGVSAVHTFILCFGMRLLMGLCVGIVYRAMTKACKNGTANCFVASLSAPLLNTLFSWAISLVFYHTDYVQALSWLRASNPLMFVVLLTGVQGLVEVVVCSVAGTAIGGALLKVTGRMNGHR